MTRIRGEEAFTVNFGAEPPDAVAGLLAGRRVTG
jgi:hypothetical protein